MTTKNYFIVESIICLIFGISLIFLADDMAKEYLTNPALANDGTRVLGKGYGSLLIGISVAFWVGRNAGPSIGRRSMLLLAFISNVALLIIHPMAIFANVETSFAWGTVLIDLVIAVWGGMLLMKETSVES